ncbi:hypothetical protein [Serratia symbiotica]|uniref:Transposase n=1 Tax=Serratia symbiotica TaxID=138074 RepID=A0A068Z9W0_9GAMM|nr:hypothetical protein [Serratia symbiotica]QLH63271.1 hypothetical protein SYMBAF_10480 [Serratia symbiotica]CDS57701.1 conserved hypothetical protein [Serratia symbiotica]
MNKAFTTEFKLEAAKWVLDQNYTYFKGREGDEYQPAYQSRTNSGR